MHTGKQSFELRLARLLYMLDTMADKEGVEKSTLCKMFGVSVRTLERDIDLLDRFFRIHKGYDSGKRVFSFDKERFYFDDIRKPFTIEQLRTSKREEKNG
jgi:predicted DNA-binding transcriptional regulator YafY